MSTKKLLYINALESIAYYIYAIFTTMKTNKKRRKISILLQINTTNLREYGEYFKKGDAHTMIKKLSSALNVDVKAVGFWSNVLYLCNTDEEIELLLGECAGKTRREIDRYVTERRKEKLINERYSSVEEFIEYFNRDKVSALERMFQEPMNSSKLRKLITNDPNHIYSIHSTLPFAVWFMSFVVYL